MDKLEMIYSMTGYAVVAQEVGSGSLSLELRSVNHRYLDIQFRLPDEFRLLEPAMRELLAARLSRGKVDCRLSFSRYAGVEDLQRLNADLLQRLLELNRAVKTALPDARSLGVAEILHWPGMLGADASPADTARSEAERGAGGGAEARFPQTAGFAGNESARPADNLRGPCMELLSAALGEFAAARAREGEKLKAMLLERLEQMRRLTAATAPRIPALLAAFQEKLAVRLREAMINCDDDRIRQELALFAGKIDVDEELSRLRTHLDEVERILLKGGAVGKRLDFLMQELNREANTLGSKSVDTEVSKIAMELKVLIEQMREQVQNIE